MDDLVTLSDRDLEELAMVEEFADEIGIDYCSLTSAFWTQVGLSEPSWVRLS